MMSSISGYRHHYEFVLDIHVIRYSIVEIVV